MSIIRISAQQTGCILSSLALGLFAAGLAAAEESAVRAPRVPITYDAAVTFHEVDPGLHAPSRFRDRGGETQEPSGSSGPSGLTAPSWSSGGLLPPPPPPAAAEQRQRNWIRPRLESDALHGRDDETETESTGWGWLADEVRQLREERDAEETDEQSERRQTSNLDAGLMDLSDDPDMIDILPSQRDSSASQNDRDNERERDDPGAATFTLNENQPVIRELIRDSAVGAFTTTDAMDRREMRETPDAWSLDEEPSALPDTITRLNAPSLPSFRADPMPPALQSGSGWSSEVGGTAARGRESSFSSTAETWNNSGSLGRESGALRSEEAWAPTPWSSGWSEDTSWKNTDYSSRESATPSSTPSTSPAGGLTGGGLSDFQSRWISGP
jgi:hypothetical protein